MHAQIFGKNFMAQCFWDTHFFSYLSNCQTMIWTDDFMNFCNIIVSFQCWWPSQTRTINNRSSALFEMFPPLIRLSPAHGFFPECYFQHFKCLSNRFSNFHTEFQIRCSWKTLIFLSRENRQTRQTCDHIMKHSTMTKQDRAMRFSRRSLSNSLLESSTCHAPLGRRNGGLFWTFGNFPDSPCIQFASCNLSSNIWKSDVCLVKHSTQCRQTAFLGKESSLQDQQKYTIRGKSFNWGMKV